VDFEPDQFQLVGLEPFREVKSRRETLVRVPLNAIHMGYAQNLWGGDDAIVARRRAGHRAALDVAGIRDNGFFQTSTWGMPNAAARTGTGSPCRSRSQH
jgi:hypothetical protein